MVKKNKLLTLIIIIQSILILGLGGFFIYKNFDKNKGTIEEPNKEKIVFDGTIYDFDGNNVTPDYQAIKERIKEIEKEYNYGFDYTIKFTSRDCSKEETIGNYVTHPIEFNKMMSVTSMYTFLDKLKSAYNAEYLDTGNKNINCIKYYYSLDFNYALNNNVISPFNVMFNDENGVIYVNFVYQGKDDQRVVKSYKYYFNENMVDYLINLSNQAFTLKYDMFEKFIADDISNKNRCFGKECYNMYLDITDCNSRVFNSKELSSNSVYVLLNKLKSAHKIDKFNGKDKCTQYNYVYYGTDRKVRIIAFVDNDNSILNVRFIDATGESEIWNTYSYYFNNENMLEFLKNLT